MAAPTTFKFGKMLVLLEDQTAPGTFAAPCGLSEKSLSISKELSDITVPDCNDPDAPAWTGREVRSLSATISGSGILAQEAHATWRNFALTTNFYNVRVVIAQDTTGGTVGDGGYWRGKAHLESFEVTGTLGEKLQVSITLQSDEAWTWVNH